jgi:hypothetical protein
MLIGRCRHQQNEMNGVHQPITQPASTLSSPREPAKCDLTCDGEDQPIGDQLRPTGNTGQDTLNSQPKVEAAL